MMQNARLVAAFGDLDVRAWRRDPTRGASCGGPARRLGDLIPAASASSRATRRDCPGCAAAASARAIDGSRRAQV
jgi:hypothetical protein